MNKNITRKDVRCLLMLFLIYTFAMLVFSCYTSPMYPNLFGADSAIFSLLGKGIAEGRDLYTELFDHKGPFIFFINALGHLMGGRNGIFFLQCISGFLTIGALYFTGKKLRPAGSNPSDFEIIALFALGMATFFYNFQCGNLTEEYSLPFIAVCCSLFVSYILRAENDPKHPPVYALFYGVVLAVLSLIRLNNAATVCAGILFIFIYLCWRKQYINLLHNLLAGVGGLLLVFVPVFVYFYLHDSVDEMIYATFLHNFTIIQNTGRVSIFRELSSIRLYAPLVLSGALLLRAVFRNRRVRALDGLLGCILVINLICLCVANRFPHYFLIFCPVYILFLFRYVEVNRKSAMMIALLLCAIIHMVPTLQRTASQFSLVYFDKNPRYEVVAADMEKIPEDERDSVIGYEIFASDYLAGDIVPCYKYYTLQETWAITTPSVLDDFKAWANENEPLWIILALDNDYALPKEILKDKYTLSHENPYMAFYRLNEQ